MLKIDTRLRDCIFAGQMLVEPLSDHESKLVEAQLWRDLGLAIPTQATAKKVARQA